MPTTLAITGFLTGMVATIARYWLVLKNAFTVLGLLLEYSRNVLVNLNDIRRILMAPSDTSTSSDPNAPIEKSIGDLLYAAVKAKVPATDDAILGEVLQAIAGILGEIGADLSAAATTATTAAASTAAAKTS